MNARLRFEILRRDGHRCHYCGVTAAESELHIDHVVPVALGGQDEPANLVTSCAPCNSGKASTNPDEHVVADVDQRAVRWAAAMERAAEIQAEQHSFEESYLNEFDAVWRDWHYPDGSEVMRPADWERSIRLFYRSGLNWMTLASIVGEVLPSPRVTNGDMWRYFCGAVWRALRERQAIAASIVER